VKTFGCTLLIMLVHTTTVFAAPLVLGLSTKHPLSEPQVGELLISELRCAACHNRKDASQGQERQAPDGGRMIDTADVYSAWKPSNQGGESETIIGEWLVNRGRRDDVLIATKVGMEVGGNRVLHRRGSSRVPRHR